MGTQPSVIVLDLESSDQELADVIGTVAELQMSPSVTRGDGWAVIAVRDNISSIELDRVAGLPGVKRLVGVSTPYRLASREVFREDVGIEASVEHRTLPNGLSITIGGRAPIALFVSSRWAMSSEARLGLFLPLLKEAGCAILHAGSLALDAEDASGAGVTFEELARIKDAAHEHGLAVCVEVSDARQISLGQETADLLQVGSSNMQDFSLLREMGRARCPVLLKRGAGATIEEFLLAAEYVLSNGNGRVILCESGIRTFDSIHRPRFEINAIPLLKQLTHLPLLADPSPASPRAAAVRPMAKAAIAAGADGLVVEVSIQPFHDSSGTAIDIDAFRLLSAELRPIARAMARTVGAPTPDVEPPPVDALGVLRRTDRTLAQTIGSIIGVPPELQVVSQWRLGPDLRTWLAPPLSPDSQILGRCTSYRLGAVRLSRNLSYVDLGRIDPTLAALLETKQLNLGQLFIDPRIEKLNFEFGNQEEAGEIDVVFRRCFTDETDELHPYVWRRYHAAIGGNVSFVVIEALPIQVWEHLLSADAARAWREVPQG